MARSPPDASAATCRTLSDEPRPNISVDEGIATRISSNAQFMVREKAHFVLLGHFPLRPGHDDLKACESCTSALFCTVRQPQSNATALC